MPTHLLLLAWYLLLPLLGRLLLATAPAFAQPAPLRLHVSADGRRLVQADGQPFFWLGDTAWELFHRLTLDEAAHYLRDRHSKGFTVVQAVVLAEFNGLTEPNPYGELPLVNQDPTRPNEAYFQHVDAVVNRAAALGLWIGMLPTWGDKFNKKWGVGPEVFTPANARSFGEYLGRRYRDKPVVWILGGDRNPEEPDDLAIIRAMAQGLRQGDGGQHLITYHPQGSHKSYEWFHEDPWLDFNMFQSGHGSFDFPNDQFTDAGYRLHPVKPVLDGEPRYEDHPVNWNPENGWFSDFDVRQAAYWSLLAGAAGHTYGNHNLWQVWHPGRTPISHARTPWRTALDHPGATQMGYVRRLFLSRPFLELVPDTTLLTGDTGTGAAHQRAARARDGSYLLAYSPYGLPLTVHLDAVSGTRRAAWWFDPRTGTAIRIDGVPRTGIHTFDPPGTPERGNDWVLVLDDARRNYPPPGRR
jgi:hypothetical protein